MRSLAQQIGEVERELRMRSEVYPRMVRRKQMRQAEADEHMAIMRAVRDTLGFIFNDDGHTTIGGLRERIAGLMRNKDNE